MRNTRALRNLFVFLGFILLVISVLGTPIGLQMQPAQLGATFFVAVVVAALISVVLLVGSAVLTALIEMNDQNH